MHWFPTKIFVQLCSKYENSLRMVLKIEHNIHRDIHNVPISVWKKHKLKSSKWTNTAHTFWVKRLKIEWEVTVVLLANELR